MRTFIEGLPQKTGVALRSDERVAADFPDF